MQAALLLALLAQQEGPILEAAVFAGEPAVLSAGQLLGPAISGAWASGGWAFGGRFELGVAQANDLTWSIRHYELRLGARAERTWPIGRGELGFGLALGPLLLREQRTRHQALRLEQAGLSAESGGWSAGAFAAGGAVLRLFLSQDWALVVEAGPSVLWAANEAGAPPHVGWVLSLGGAWAAGRGRPLSAD